MKKIKKFHIIAMAALGPGFSGGDRIFLELAKRWQKKFPVRIYVWEEGRQMCRRHALNPSKNLKFVIWKMGDWGRAGFYVNYLARIVRSIIGAFQLNLRNEPSTYVYSASDFWMDALPGWILKLRFPKITWVGTFYLAAPSPFKGFKEEGEFRLPTIKSILYFLQQLPIYWLIRIFSDKVFVTSQPDAKRFPKHERRGKIVVARGGVYLPKKVEKMKRIYDGLFLGRFHPQKGVTELVDIWEKVVAKKPKARLVMIGDGPLMDDVKAKIKEKNLGKNIELAGYLPDGKKKYDLFQKGKIFMHSAVYDSGGMACAEGMAWGMPGVSFNLEALKTYYPKGVLKAPINDFDAYARLVLKLLKDSTLYNKTTKDAVSLVKEYWDWDKRAEDIHAQIVS